MSKQLGFAEKFALGGVASVISTTGSAPIVRIKLLWQCHEEMLKSGRLSERYKGIIDCTKRTYKTEGIRQFWRGNLVNCIKYLPSQALNFALKDKIKIMFKSSNKDPNLVQFGKNIASGGVAGAISIAVVYPFSYTHVRLANDVISGGGRQFTGIIDVFRKTLTSDGIVGLYRGFVVSCVGIMVYRGCYFGLYDSLKPVVLGDNVNVISAFMLGYSTTLVSVLLCYPLDTIRYRMLMRSCEPVKYKGSVDCARTILRNEGFKPLMRGAGVSILSGITGGAVLVGYDTIKALYIDSRLDR